MYMKYDYRLFSKGFMIHYTKINNTDKVNSVLQFQLLKLDATIEKIKMVVTL